MNFIRKCHGDIYSFILRVESLIEQNAMCSKDMGYVINDILLSVYNYGTLL